jgi:chromosomal replication initiation ATPase DnaA
MIKVLAHHDRDNMSSGCASTNFILRDCKMITKWLNEILEVCCEEFEVNIDDVKSKSKKTDHFYCRLAFIIIAKEKFDLCNNKIGSIINRTHNDIHYVYNNPPNNRYFSMVLQSIKEKLKHV